jgi:hypothetical protein
MNTQVLLERLSERKLDEQTAKAALNALLKYREAAEYCFARLRELDRKRAANHFPFLLPPPTNAQDDNRQLLLAFMPKRDA